MSETCLCGGRLIDRKSRHGVAVLYFVECRSCGAVTGCVLIEPPLQTVYGELARLIFSDTAKAANRLTPKGN